MASEPGSGLTLIVLNDAKVAEIMDKGRELLETQYRQALELGKAGIRPEAQESNGCCNCVLC